MKCYREPTIDSTFVFLSGKRYKVCEMLVGMYSHLSHIYSIFHRYDVCFFLSCKIPEWPKTLLDL